MRDTIEAMESGTTRTLNYEADSLIAALYAGQVGWSARTRARDKKIGAAFAALRHCDRQTAAFARMVYGHNTAPLLEIEPILPRLGAQPGNTGIDALLHIARYAADWLHEPESWRPDSREPRNQIASLTRHLFGIYPLPVFLDTAWLGGFDANAEAYRLWFIHLGAGEKLEAIRFPMPLTHRAAHYFLNAPGSYTVPMAMRYGQIVALGGTPRLADAVGESFLAELQADESFWLSFTHFLVNHSNLPTYQIAPLADFVRFRRFGTSHGDAPEPGFTMKGRTVDSLLARMAQWHDELASLGKGSQKVWASSGIGGLDRHEQDKLSAAVCHWRIVELTDSLSLLEEGSRMRHCVRTYQDGCVEGKRSIWSLRLTLSDSPTLRRLLTIEVDNRRRAIVQVRGKCNQSLGTLRGNRRMQMARAVLREWAAVNSLGIGCSLG